MRALLGVALYGLSALSAGIAWTLQFLPLPFIGLSRWAQWHAERLKSFHQQ